MCARSAPFCSPSEIVLMLFVIFSCVSAGGLAPQHTANKTDSEPLLLHVPQDRRRTGTNCEAESGECLAEQIEYSP